MLWRLESCCARCFELRVTTSECAVCRSSVCMYARNAVEAQELLRTVFQIACDHK
jgi:hypothetical protein